MAQALTLDQANRIIAVALARATRRRHRPRAIVVANAGHLKSAQRQDGASMFRIDIATAKAWAAVAMGASSRALAERAQDNPNFFNTLAGTAHGRFLPQAGGVLIKDRLSLCRLISGSMQDRCAYEPEQPCPPH